MPITTNTDDNEQKKFVDSPSRGGKNSAVETVSTVILKNPNGEYIEKSINGEKSEFSSNTALLSGQSFNSGIVDLNGYQFISGEIFADKDGVFTGTWYDDSEGTNALRTFTAPYSSDNGLSFLSVPRLSKFFSLNFVNNSSEDQTAFYLRLNLSNESYSPQLIQLDQFLPSNAIATINRSVITGVTPSGQYKNVGVNDLGALETTDFNLDIALGNYSGVSSFTKIGRIGEIDPSNQPQDIWGGEDNYTGQPIWGTTPEQLEIRSTSNLDASSGSGARTITLYGLDESGNRQNYTAELNGTSWVVIPDSTWSRMNYAEVETAGSTGSNQGTITARWVTTTNQVFMEMPPGLNKTAIGASTVPKGFTRIIFNTSCRITRQNGSAGSANIRFLTREPGGVFQAKINDDITVDSPFLLPDKAYIVLPELTDLKWRVEDVSDTNTTASCVIPWIEYGNVEEVQLTNDRILLENGDSLLLENGDFLLI